ncbi:MAG: ATPase, T2SS/T4P/T4SS family, partial [Planctomycetota bacterium]|nr:ATPase, T2SS/T4P/T4SS family [Planctomycetota bacterium]
MNPLSSTTDLSLPSVLNQAHSGEFDSLWERILKSDNCVIDASKVVNIDSDGLQMLVDGVHNLHRQGRLLKLSNASPTLQAVGDTFRLHDILGIADTRRDSYCEDAGSRLGEVLIGLGYLENEALKDSLQKSSERPDSYLGQILLEEEHINQEQLAKALAIQHDLPFINPVDLGLLDVSLDCDVPFAELRVHGILPYMRLNDTIAVALKDPADVYASDIVRKYTGLSVITTVSTPEIISTGLDQLQRANAGGIATESADEDEVPIEQRFNEIVVNAIIEGASDIHIEPFQDNYLLRYRVDGRLHETSQLSSEIGSSLVARVKVAAGCDISEKRLPQDGRIHFADGSRDVDLRVNTLPTVHGEKAV